MAVQVLVKRFDRGVGGAELVAEGLRQGRAVGNAGGGDGSKQEFIYEAGRRCHGCSRELGKWEWAGEGMPDAHGGKQVSEFYQEMKSPRNLCSNLSFYFTKEEIISEWHCKIQDWFIFGLLTESNNWILLRTSRSAPASASASSSSWR
jgi:hypothetical protein